MALSSGLPVGRDFSPGVMRHLFVLFALVLVEEIIAQAVALSTPGEACI
jgi:hypothetical protein